MMKYSPEICAWCNGSGIEPERKGLLGEFLSVSRVCPACNGEGSVLVAQNPKKCSYCNGVGRDPDPGFSASFGDSNEKKCRVCRGSGWENIKQDESKEVPNSQKDYSPPQRADDSNIQINSQRIHARESSFKLRHKAYQFLYDELYELSIRCCDEIINRSFSNITESNYYKTDAYNIKGKALYYLGHLNEAMSSFDNAILLDAGNLESWLWKGECLNRLDRAREARECFIEVRDTCNNRLSSSKWTYSQTGKYIYAYYMGIALLRLGQPHLALEQFIECIECDPGLSEDRYYYWQAAALRQLNRDSEASASLKKAYEKGWKGNEAYMFF